MSAKIAADPILKAAIATTSNVAVYDPVTGTTIPKWVGLDLTYNRLTVALDYSTSTAADKTFLVCAGLTVSNANTGTVFSNSNYQQQFGLDEYSSPLYDKVSAVTRGVTAPAAINQTTLFCKGILYNAGGNTLGATPACMTGGSQHWTAECLYQHDPSSFFGQFFYGVNGTDYLVSCIFDQPNNRIELIIKNGYGIVGYAYTNMSPFGAAWYHVAFSYDGTGATNADRLKSYIDGVQQVLSFSYSIPSNMPAGLGTLRCGGNSSTLHDEIGFMSDNKDANFLQTRSNMFLYSDFWTIGAGVSPSVKDLFPIV